MEANRKMILSDSQVVWFVDNILEMAKKPTSSFFEREGKDADGRSKLSKIDKAGKWSMRCVVWPKVGDKLFIHVPTNKATKD